MHGGLAAGHGGIAIVEARQAGALRADAAHAGGASRTGTSRWLQPPQFVDVAHEVEAVVDGAVAVVVEAVADLDAIVGLHALAAVARILVGVEEVRSEQVNLHMPGDARGRRVRDDARWKQVPQFAMSVCSSGEFGLQSRRCRPCRFRPRGAAGAADAAGATVATDRPAGADAEVGVADSPVGAAARIDDPGIDPRRCPERVKMVTTARRRDRNGQRGKALNFTKLTDRPEVIVLRVHYSPNRSKDKYRLVNAARQNRATFAARQSLPPQPPHAVSSAEVEPGEEEGELATRRVGPVAAVDGVASRCRCRTCCRIVPAGAFFESVGPITSR